MLEVRPSHDKEIDIFELFEILWLGKWLISAFVAISVLLGGGFLFFFKKPIYESKIVFSVESPIQYYKDKKIKYDFKGKFNSKSTFDAWKSENEKSELVYKDFGIEKVIEGFTFAKEEKELFAYIVEDKKNSLSALVIKSNNMSLINEFFKYVNFVNNKLTSDYLLREKKVLKAMQTQFVNSGQNINKSKDSEIREIQTNRFIIATESGSKVMSLNPPSVPKKISPKIKLILALSIVLGGMIGAVIVLVNNTIRKRKESVSKV
jgi:LPS O-antigen subunit length determinant protein (WzzB/FepE family)